MTSESARLRAACRMCRTLDRPTVETPINGPVCVKCLFQAPSTFGWDSAVRVRLHHEATAPAMALDGDACWDLFASENHRIEPGQRAKVPCGFDIQLKPGWEAHVRPKSGLSLKGIDVAFGTIDSNFRGTLCATVINNGRTTHYIASHEKVAQMAVRVAPRVTLLLVPELDDSNRGTAGWGSTGI